MTEVKRHLFLTIWLSLIIIVNLFSAAMYFIMPERILDVIPTLPQWYTYVFGIFAVLNVLFAVALFKWKKWGFYGFCLFAVLSSIINVYLQVIGILPAVLVPIISILILFWALNVGKENKAWSRLT